MTSYNPIYNIAYRQISKSINILYVPYSGLFDILVQELDAHLYPKDQGLQNYYYDLLWHNNFLEHIQETLEFSVSNQLVDLVWFHDRPPNKFKKEDTALVRNQLSNTIKVFSDIEIIKSWGLKEDEKNIIIPYGVPYRPELVNVKKTESVLVINPRNSADINSVYQHIKTEFPTAGIINNLNDIVSVEALYETIGKYQIVVDIYNPLSVLIAQSLGCKSVTSVMHSAALSGITILSDYNNINQILKSMVNDTLSDEDIARNQEHIKQNHNFETFINTTQNLLTRIKHQEFFVL